MQGGSNSNSQWFNRKKKIKFIKKPYTSQSQYVFSSEQFNRDTTKHKVLTKRECKIYYPYQSIHPVQERYIQNVIQALAGNKELIAQSPTGTGKTMCLLTGVLAWAEHYYHLTQGRERLNIIYTSKLHSQLEQIKKQVEKTCYRPNTIIYASRQKLCVNQKMREESKKQTNYKQWASKCDSAIKENIQRQAYRQQLQFIKKILIKLKQIPQEQIIKKIKQIIEKQQTKQVSAKDQKTKFKFSQDQNYQTNDQLYATTQACEARVLNIQKQLQKKGIACKYFEQKTPQNQKQINFFNQHIGRQPTNLSDMTKLGRDHIFCPYFFPKRQKGSGIKGLILRPYNYLLNQRMVGISRQLIKNSIIIFDQGHNILTAAAEGCDFKFDNKLIEQAIKDIDNYLNKRKKYLKDLKQQDIQDYHIDSADQQCEQEQNQNNRINNKKKQQLKNKWSGVALCNNLKTILTIMVDNYNEYFSQKQQSFNVQSDTKNSLQANINVTNQNIQIQEAEEDKIKQRTIKFKRPAERIQSYFKQVFFEPRTPENFKDRKMYRSFVKYLEFVSSLISKVVSCMSDVDVFHYKMNNLRDSLNKIIKILSAKGPEDEYYNQYFLQINQWSQINKQKQKIYKGKLMFKCLTAKFMFNKLRTLGPYSIIVTSGTLIPMNKWSQPKQFGTPNNGIILLQNNQIILPKQIFVRTICNDLNGQAMVFASKAILQNQNKYQQEKNKINKFKKDNQKLAQDQDNDQFQDDIQGDIFENCLQTIFTIIKKTPIPNGVLIIVPSYKILNKFKKYYDQNPNSQIVKGINLIKKFHFQQKANYKVTKERYEADAGTTGAILFCVYRGKMSEGIDFKDQLCRCVFSIGIPIANFSIPYIHYKKLDDKTFLNSEAARAISQGVGRAIRHQFDYGAIIFIDARFRMGHSSYNLNGVVLEQISQFVQRQNRIEDDYGKLCRQLSQFYEARRNE